MTDQASPMGLRSGTGLGSARKLRIVGFRVRSPDESDRAAAATLLDSVAASTNDGVGLRDRPPSKQVGDLSALDGLTQKGAVVFSVPDQSGARRN
jgi:hypothetical protein